MKPAPLFGLLLGLFACAGSVPAAERIDPAGIKGSLVISGAGRPGEALEAFFQLAQGKKARVVVLRFDDREGSKAETQQLLAQWEGEQGHSFETIRLGGDAAAPSLESVTGVWLIAAETLSDDQVGDEMRAALVDLLERGGVIGGSGAAGDALGAPLGLLPSGVVDTHHADRSPASPLAAALEATPSLVGYEITRDSALVVRGRRMRVVGAGGGGEVRVHFAASEHHAAKQVELVGRRGIADLTALRNTAVARQAAPFPAPEPPPPVVENGTLIIIGGGGTPKGLISKFVELAGGAEASIVVLPTANPDPISERVGIDGAFRKAGAKEVTVLPGRTLDVVDGDEYLEAFGRATGIWFGGGRQWRFADAYLGTEALAAMHRVLERGGVIMGSSAGASIQAGYLARANPLGNRDIMAEGYERGLGFIRGVAIDQHFAQRGRFKDMTTLVDRYPQLLGIGIDEGTALVVEKEIGTVVGAAAVHFYDRGKPVVEGLPDYESVGAGGSYDLKARKIIDAGGVAGAEGEN